MNNTKELLKNQWEKTRVQRVLDYFNKTHGSNIVILDKSDIVYPQLKGQLNWDWVCHDNQTQEEIAIEVKKITNSELEKKSKILYRLLKEVQDHINDSKILLGTFHLFFSIHGEYPSRFGKQENKRELQEALIKVVYEVAPTLNLSNETNIETQIQNKLSFRLPDMITITLFKLDNQNSIISTSPGFTWWEVPSFDMKELNKFSQLVEHANQQLDISKANRTFLILIEEGFRPIDITHIQEAFGKIESVSFSRISYIYLVRGSDISQIVLPA